MNNTDIHESVFIAEGAKVIGNVTMGSDCSVWFNAVIRAENTHIEIGEGTNIQDNCVLHVDPWNDIRIGNFVTIGHGAIVHGCTIGDNSLIGMGAIVMNDAVIGKNCIIAAGAVVTEGTVIEDQSLVVGIPGKCIKKVSREQIVKSHENALHYIEMAQRYKEA